MYPEILGIGLSLNSTEFPQAVRNNNVNIPNRVFTTVLYLKTYNLGSSPEIIFHSWSAFLAFLAISLSKNLLALEFTKKNDLLPTMVKSFVLICTFCPTTMALAQYPP